LGSARTSEKIGSILGAREWRSKERGGISIGTVMLQRPNATLNMLKKREKEKRQNRGEECPTGAVLGLEGEANHYSSLWLHKKRVLIKHAVK